MCFTKVAKRSVLLDGLGLVDHANWDEAYETGLWHNHCLAHPEKRPSSVSHPHDGGQTVRKICAVLRSWMRETTSQKSPLVCGCIVQADGVSRRSCRPSRYQLRRRGRRRTSQSGPASRMRCSVRVVVQCRSSFILSFDNRKGRRFLNFCPLHLRS